MKKLYKKLILSFLLAVVMCIMPIGAALFNSDNSMVAMADEMEKEVISFEELENDNTVSGNEPSEPEELSCICTETCKNEIKNETCEVCKEDYSLCEYKEPKVRIDISVGSGWYKKSATVRVSVKDTLETGNLKIDTVKAKIGQNGVWEDITADMSLTIAEDSSIYVQVTDSREKTYAANKHMECFDTDKPTINGAINDGLLSVQAYDTTSEITVIYVNGHEFKNLTNGTLSIRLQQFDSGYEYFTMQAMDEAGNVSDVYKMKNPYYIDPEKEKKDTDTEKEKNPLPVNAKPTEPTDAKATVTEQSSDTKEKEEKSSDTKESVDPEKGGKEFYTIQTKSQKVFYLVIDKEQTENNVYLLTEVSENDLLNFTESDNEVLPQNSAVVESALPKETATKVEKETQEDISPETDTEKGIEQPADISDEEERTGNAGTYLIMIVALVGVGGAYYYIKFIKGKNITFDDEEEEFEDEDTKEYEEDVTEETEPASDSEYDE